MAEVERRLKPTPVPLMRDTTVSDSPHQPDEVALGLLLCPRSFQLAHQLPAPVRAIMTAALLSAGSKHPRSVLYWCEPRFPIMSAVLWSPVFPRMLEKSSALPLPRCGRKAINNRSVNGVSKSAVWAGIIICKPNNLKWLLGNRFVWPTGNSRGRTKRVLAYARQARRVTARSATARNAAALFRDTCPSVSPERITRAAAERGSPPWMFSCQRPLAIHIMHKENRAGMTPPCKCSGINSRKVKIRVIRPRLRP